MSIFGQSSTGTSSGLFGGTKNASGSLFGSSNQPTTTNLFGSNTANQQQTNSAPSAGLFGNLNQQASGLTPSTTNNIFGAQNQNTNASNVSQTGGLFGSNATTSSTLNSPAPGGMFGATTNSNNLLSGSGLFGSSKPLTSIPAPASAATAGLFGATNNNSANTITQPPGGTGLFGSNAAQPSQGLFGSSVTSTPATGTGATSIFGNSTQTSNNNSNLAQNNNIFGSLNNSQPRNLNTGTSSLFSSTSQNNNQSLASGGLFGPKNPLSMIAPGSGLSPSVSQANSIFTRTTRFNDLPDDSKKQLEMLDALIQSQCRYADALKALQLGTEINEGTSLLRQVTSEMYTASASITTSSNLLDSIRQKIDADVSDLLKLSSIIESSQSNQRINNLATQSSSTSSSLPLLDPIPNPLKFQFDYFCQKSSEMEDRIKSYRQTIEFVELQLKSLYDKPSPASIVPALKAQYSTFMVLADRVAQLDTELRSLKDEYREIWRHQTGSVRDPFAEVDRAFSITL
ncbi:hypothetical protein PPACK8108_LOCUS25794 [Phakopsora pachyrhizi]|uniref:Uncharacterized protein n=1 Tax=Phakopsora pachyrhizi TaxID=170000 RepID=A0AAV0BSM5_PHAPC|nr:hypothetical protein PPACK8108_LOCUS25794 [Phakopsora pachyrhizi]